MVSKSQELVDWENKYNPILYIGNGHPEWETIWDKLAELIVPFAFVWINYDDDGICYLTSMTTAPKPDVVDYIGVFVSQKPYLGASDMFLVTDKDEPCATCNQTGIVRKFGFSRECETCSGTGQHWIEFQDTRQYNTDSKILEETVFG
jgi:hypothetical protein